MSFEIAQMHLSQTNITDKDEDTSAESVQGCQ